MNTVSIKPNGYYTFSDEYLRRKCKRIYQDKTKYYATKSKLFQTLCRVYVDNQKTIFCFSIDDCGVRDIKEVGFSLLIKTNDWEYQFENVETYLQYIIDNKAQLFFTIFQPLTIEKCELRVEWIQYFGIPDNSREKIEENFVIPSNDNLKTIRKINRIRKGSTEKHINKKDAIPVEKVEKAWKAYEELLEPLSILKKLNSNTHNYNFTIESTDNSSCECCLVPINCYFDKGFYATIYYVQNYPVIKKKFSGGESSIQCVIAVNKKRLNLLMYLYCCTIADRDYYQYMDSDQIKLKEYLECNHPVMMLLENLQNIREKWGYLDVIEKSDVVKETNEILSEFHQQIKFLKRNAYDKLLSQHQLHGKWVKEIELFALIKAIFPDAQYQYTAEWLGNQSLDIYIPKLQCGIEYQGEQHYKAIDFFGGESKLLEQKQLDQQKREKCIKQKVLLLDWPYFKKINIENVRGFFVGKVSKEDLDREKIESRLEAYPVYCMNDFLAPIQNY